MSATLDTSTIQSVPSIDNKQRCSSLASLLNRFQQPPSYIPTEYGWTYTDINQIQTRSTPTLQNSSSGRHLLSNMRQSLSKDNAKHSRVDHYTKSTAVASEIAMSSRSISASTFVEIPQLAPISMPLESAPAKQASIDLCRIPDLDRTTTALLRCQTVSAQTSTLSLTKNATPPISPPYPSSNSSIEDSTTFKDEPRQAPSLSINTQPFKSCHPPSPILDSTEDMPPVMPCSLIQDMGFGKPLVEEPLGLRNVPVPSVENSVGSKIEDGQYPPLPPLPPFPLSGEAMASFGNAGVLDLFIPQDQKSSSHSLSSELLLCPGTDSFDPAELIRRPSDVEFENDEMVTLFGYLLSLTSDSLVEFQKCARFPHQDLLSDYDVDKNTLRFALPLNYKQGQRLTETVTISLKDTKPSTKFTWFLPPIDERYTLSVETLTPKKLCKSSFTFNFCLTYHKFTTVNVIVMLEVKGGYRHFFVINTASTAGKDTFLNNSICWKHDDTVADSIYLGRSWHVPQYLSRMRLLLVSKNGQRVVGIFREKGNSWDVQTLQAKMMEGIDWNCNDVHAISTCIKLYLRDFISPCNRVSAYDIIRYGSLESTVANQDASWNVLNTALKTGSPIWRVTMWTLDLMVSIVRDSAWNQMGTKGIVTAFAPSLYTIANAGTCMQVARHLVPFLHNVLMHHIRSLRQFV
ncbi:hypothetical protein QVD99_004242 [Batrachochytrium dendrobatidis]|nr:hypothetical protein QVD99_004242 [Batrachochytrium dendrobatidis]